MCRGIGFEPIPVNGFEDSSYLRMSKRIIFDFLRDLAENNSKRWMDANRDRYEEAKEVWILSCKQLIEQLADIDEYYQGMEAKDAIERINNNLLYHPDKPTYKDHFGFSPGEHKGAGLYVSVSPSYSFIGGGVHNPDNAMLKDIRIAIDKEGDKLQDILDDKNFREFFDGGLEEDPKMLKTSPQGYPTDHPHIDLLRRKNFTVSTRITQKEVLSDDFPAIVGEGYKRMMPLLHFMRGALG